MVGTTSRPPYSLQCPGTHCVGGWVSPRAAWKVAENLGHTGIRSPDQLVASRYTDYTISAHSGDEKVKVKVSLISHEGVWIVEV